MILSYRKIFISTCILFSLQSLHAVAQHVEVVAKKATTPAKGSVEWNTSPFDTKVFIENLGQCNISSISKDKVLYSASLGDVKLYFTSHGIIYNYIKYSKNGREKPLTGHLITEWENSNATCKLNIENELPYTFHYSNGKNETVIAKACRKLIYQDIYPGIDIEYYFPDNKEGFEYDVIVHPGGDITKLKLQYTEATNSVIDELGNVVISTPIGEMTDHMPTSTYEDGSEVKIKYTLSGNIESFEPIGEYDRTKAITIDPWTTNPNFTAKYDKAYDLDYDVNGNIYVYGSYNPFQLIKLNSSGVIQWAFAYNATSIDGAIYGGLAVDKSSGTSYLIEGARVAGARILKVNSLGALVATSVSDTNMNEMWRPLFNTCNHNLIIGAGGTKTGSNIQVSTVDTSFASFKNFNVLGATKAGHSVVLAALDPSGTSCYMAMAKSAVIDPTQFNNVFVKLPLPGISPTTYAAADGYKFVELASINYVGSGIGTTNGMNGMAASLNWLYMYDGGELKRFNKTTGALVDSVKVTSNPYSWGGLDADICDNVYAGSQKWISIYNSSFGLADTINLPDTVYDVKIGENRQVILACGKGFVRSVNIPFNPLSISSKNATCSCNGTATANLCGGADTTNITYLWSNGKTTQTVSGLCGGKYKVTVTLGGCSPVNYFDSVTITQPTPLTATISAKTNVKCNGGIGNATVTIKGGSKPYTYLWSPTGGTSAVADTLPAGSYTVTVTDSNKCTATATVTITQPTVLKDTSIGTLAHCGKNDASATATVTGGVTPYTYSWAPGGQTKATATSLSAGTFVVTVTDANGCTVNSTTIIKDSGVTPSISLVDSEKCFGQSIGSATVAMNNSLASTYTYSWAPSGQTTATATNLLAITYTATVTDGNGCIVSDTITIPQPKLLLDNMEVANVSCKGDSTGSITASMTGGTSPYTFTWNPGGATDSTILKLPAGKYVVSVTDAHGCSTKDSATLTQPSGVIATTIIKTSPVSCTGGKNGSLTDSTSGGTAPYSYNWGIPGDTTATADSLPAGTYNVVVTDANGCTTSTSQAVTQPSKALADTIISTNNRCDGDSNGTAIVIASGGTKPYTYTWSPGSSTNDTITKLISGTYSVTIVDSNSCKGSGSVTITQPPLLNISITTVATPCNKNNGSATVTVTGEPFTYSWSPGTNTSVKDSGLAAGNYTVTITDTNGCKTDTVAVVPHSIPPNVTTTWLPSTCDSTNGAAIANATGGKGQYTYSWAPGGQTGDTAKRVGPGIYTVTVTDSNGCTNSATAIVGDVGVSAGLSSINDVTCFGLSNGSVTASISTNNGPFTYSWAPGGQTTATASSLSAGTYTVIINDVNNCTATDTITILQPAILAATIPAVNIKNVSCFGDSNGSAFPTVSGGTKPFSFIWTDGEKTDTAKALAAGTYTVNITDINSCPASTTVTITQPQLLTITTSTTAATCGNNGSATGTAKGGTLPYVYTWGSAGAGVTISGIGTGTYTVTVTDSNSCTATDTANVIPSGQLAYISASNNVKCFGASTGSATVMTKNGDTLLYSFTWSPGNQSSATATNLTAGIYTVVVNYYADGCVDTVYDTITQPSKLIVAPPVDTIQCNSTTANIQVVASGGVPGYNYSWNGGKTTASADTSLPAGNYTLTVTDNNGCQDVVNTTVSVPSLNANFKPEPDTVLGGEYIYFKDESSGATTWYWTFGNENTSDSVNPYQQYVEAGKYDVYLYVTNAKGCRDSIEKTVYVIATLFIPNVFTPNGDGINDAFHITAGNMEVYDLTIYNRWGEKVFESDSPNIDWTGTSPAGVAYPTGTYYYILKATDYENKEYNLRGYLELIR